MLFILTGDIQIGKTRWLQGVCDQLVDGGVPVAGVLAPGVWRANPMWPNGFEKLGIDNVLLPGGERIEFARRRDLADSAVRSRLDDGMPAEMKLAWQFSDEAVDRVNAHFDKLASQQDDSGKKGLLVVDELGRLELERGVGLTSAMSLFAQGPRPGWPHALIVVREWLVPRAHAMFDAPWSGAVREISPTPAEKAGLLAEFGL